MGLLQSFGGGQGYFKGGLFGWQGSGKTYTAILLAVGLKRYFKLDGPIVMYDSEGGSEYIAPLVKHLTGQDVVGLRSQSLADLIDAGKEAIKVGASVYLADSVTHPWRELCQSHLARVNEARREKNLPPRTRLELADWNQIKPAWQPWTDFYLNSPLHTIICARAGNIFEEQMNEETDRLELKNVGVKAKTEGEFGYEPSCLGYLEQEQTQEGQMSKGRRRPRVIRHRITIFKDRFGVLNGVTGIFDAEEPEEQITQTFGFFEPHIKLLTPGAYAPVDTTLKTDTGANAEGDSAWTRERQARVILCEEIQGELVAALPGQDAQAKKLKADLLQAVFKTRSWTAVEQKPSNMLRAGLEVIRKELDQRGLRQQPSLLISAEPEPTPEPMGGVTPEEADRLLMVSRCEGREAKLRLAWDYQTYLRQKHMGMEDLHAASLDGVTAYYEALGEIESGAAPKNANSQKREK